MAWMIAIALVGLGVGLAPIAHTQMGTAGRHLVADEQPGMAPIGVARMQPDGTIVIELHRTADGIFVSMPPQEIKPTDPTYAAILRHVGPLAPGETKLVMPWPDAQP